MKKHTESKGCRYKHCNQQPVHSVNQRKVTGRLKFHILTMLGFVLLMIGGVAGAVCCCSQVSGASLWLWSGVTVVCVGTGLFTLTADYDQQNEVPERLRVTEEAEA